jgi:hypothetical protein
MSEKPLHPAIAAGLSLVAPGLGLLFVGRARLAFSTVALWFVLPTGVQVLAMNLAPGLMPLGRIGTSALLLILSAALAFSLARQPRPRQGYQHWWWLFGFGFLAWAATVQVQTRWVAPRIGFAIRAPDNLMGPSVAHGQIVVIDPQRAVDRGDVVLWTGLDPQQPRFGLARVVATPGQTVRTEGESLLVDDAPPTDPVGARVGAGCAIAVTSVAAGQRLLLPDVRTADSCATTPRVVQVTDLQGVVVSPSRTSSSP